MRPNHTGYNIAAIMFLLMMSACGREKNTDLPPDRVQIGQEYLALDSTNIYCVYPETSLVNGLLVGIDLLPEAASWFERITAANIGKPIDFVLNGQIVISPIIQEQIEGGGLSIRPYSDDGQALIDQWLNDIANVPICETVTEENW